jgi:hypothetical protein
MDTIRLMGVAMKWGVILLLALGYAPASGADGVPHHQVKDIWRVDPGNIWYFIVAPKETAIPDLEVIAEHYAAENPQAGVVTVHIHCDDRYASYARGVASSVSEDDYYSHVLYDYRTGMASDVHGPMLHLGQGSACRR